MTWEAAQEACVQEGGNLASIDMSYDQAFVAGVVLHGREAWIGLRRKVMEWNSNNKKCQMYSEYKPLDFHVLQDDGSYMWTDGWPVFFTQWGPGEPSNIKDEGCVAMHGSRAFHGTWNDTRCDLTKPYICKISSGTEHKLSLNLNILGFNLNILFIRPHNGDLCYTKKPYLQSKTCHLTEKPPPTPAPGSGMCLPFWVPYGRYCYYVYNSQQGYSWPDSRHYCQSIRGDLASIHSRAEVEFIRNLNHTKYHNVWIGLTRDNNCERSQTNSTIII